MRAVRIETSPFQILSLVEFESILKKNQHGCAKISGYISCLLYTSPSPRDA